AARGATGGSLIPLAARRGPPRPREGELPGGRFRPAVTLRAPMSDARATPSPPSHAKREALRRMIGAGEIDTLIVALTDMQGRLMGKRVQGQAFLGGAVDHGAHFCTYL